MRSARPKPLHQICGRPMTLYVLDAVADVRATVVVVGHGATWVEKELSARAHARHLTFVEQSEQLGTGHAVAVALPTVNDELGASDGDVLIVPGDTPLLRRSTVNELLAHHRKSQAALSVLTAEVDDPSGYGRILRGRDGAPVGIVEQRDASADELLITEINTSIMVVRANVLGPALRRVGRQNAQHEYYLTDLVAVLHDAGHLINAVVLDDPLEASGVNDRSQLADVETEVRRRINERWMQRGVTMWDPATTYVDAEVELAAEVSLLPGTVLKGHCVVGHGARIGPNAYLRDVSVGENARLGTVEAVNVRIGADARVTSHTVLAAGSEVPAGAVVGRDGRPTP